MRPSFSSIFAAAAIAAAGAAIAGCGGASNGSATAASRPPAHATVAAAHMSVVVKSDEQHGRKGPDGKWHDAFLPADFRVEAGQRVTVTVSNYDDMPHSFTAPRLGVNAKIPAGHEHRPGTVTFSFTAPARAGAYAWFCAMPCDPWAMSHDGYMRGHVTVTA